LFEWIFGFLDFLFLMQMSVGFDGRAMVVIDRKTLKGMCGI
jgi:hypothetical protein